MAIPIAYRINTLGAQLCINTQTDTIRLVIATHTYRLQFTVLPGQGIDAILGMNWLRVYGVVLNHTSITVDDVSSALDHSGCRMLVLVSTPEG